MSRFKPCPFCKRTEGFQVKTVWKTYKFVACKCKAAGPVMRTEEEAIEAWNTRPLGVKARAVIRDMLAAYRQLVRDWLTAKTGLIWELSGSIEADCKRAEMDADRMVHAFDGRLHEIGMEADE
ncbi:MAG: Lar family restriction alleviation protein [Atopobiaceae bacterium]|nr:Lar family restriction alleviation protein [Atopobiaceae bacterium]